MEALNEKVYGKSADKGKGRSRFVEEPCAYWTLIWIFFWRTAQRQEVDLVEESASGLKAFEVKWNPAKAGGSICQTFRNAYPRAECIGVSPLNCPEHLLRTV